VCCLVPRPGYAVDVFRVCLLEDTGFAKDTACVANAPWDRQSPSFGHHFQFALNGDPQAHCSRHDVPSGKQIFRRPNELQWRRLVRAMQIHPIGETDQ